MEKNKKRRNTEFQKLYNVLSYTRNMKMIATCMEGGWTNYLKGLFNTIINYYINN